jgi:hypothetical protein
MAEYINIKGQNIEVVASDPANPTLGQIWYNSTSNTLKGGGFQTAAWASGGNAGTARYATAGAGLQTAALAFGGSTYPPNNTQSALTEEYNGSTWSPSGNMGTARYRHSGFGTQTAAVAVGGVQNSGPGTSSVEHYNGSTWTGGTGYPVATQRSGVAGTLTAGLVWGGLNPPGGPEVNTTNEYDSSTWTAGGTFPTGIGGAAGAGTQTATISTGGFPPGSGTTGTQYYDGTSWSVQGGTLLQASQLHQLAGTQTAAVASSVQPPSANTQVWDGTSWTASSNMSTPRTQAVGAGTATAALVGVGGPFAAKTAATEEYTGAAPTTVTITAS